MQNEIKIVVAQAPSEQVRLAGRWFFERFGHAFQLGKHYSGQFKADRLLRGNFLPKHLIKTIFFNIYCIALCYFILKTIFTEDLSWVSLRKSCEYGRITATAAPIAQESRISCLDALVMTTVSTSSRSRNIQFSV